MARKTRFAWAYGREPGNINPNDKLLLSPMLIQRTGTLEQHRGRRRGGLGVWARARARARAGA